MLLMLITDTIVFSETIVSDQLFDN